MSARESIVEEIRRRGPIPFSRYMELCLYGPEGFYSRQKEQFGKAGDFYTSSDVHAVFGRLLARQFDEMWRALGSPERIDVVEFGPGRGLFAQDVMDWSEKKFPGFAQALHYTLVESSPTFRGRLEEKFGARIAAGRVAITEDFTRRTQRSHEEDRRETILFANEFFDAFPVEVVSPQGQVHVAEDNGEFREVFLPPSPEIYEYLDRYSVHPEEGERVEAPLQALQYAKEMAEIAERGFAVFIDYGYDRREQLAGRHRDTLKCFRSHTLSANPYQAPGEQDITADVNFTALSAAMSGWRELALLTQAQFLMGIGEATQFADAFEECRLPQEQAKVALQLKHLVTPAGMGEAFHALIMAKGVAEESVRTLCGLKFAH